MTLRKCLVLVCWMMVASLCAATGFAAQESGSGASGSQSGALALLMQSAEFLAGAKQLSVNIRAGYDVLQETGQKIEFEESRKLTLFRPERIRVDVERSDGDKSLVLFDGHDITVVSPNAKVFAKAAKAGDVDNAILYLLSGLKMRLPLAMMFVTKLPSELESRVRSVEEVEKTKLMDVECTHLAARTDQVDFQIWIPTQGDPLARRIVITYKNEPGQPQFWANFSEWNLSPASPPEGFFSYSPAEGVQRIAFLEEIAVAKPDAKKVGKGGKK